MFLFGNAALRALLLVFFCEEQEFTAASIQTIATIALDIIIIAAIIIIIITPNMIIIIMIAIVIIIIMALNRQKSLSVLQYELVVVVELLCDEGGGEILRVEPRAEVPDADFRISEVCCRHDAVVKQVDAGAAPRAADQCLRRIGERPLVHLRENVHHRRACGCVKCPPHNAAAITISIVATIITSIAIFLFFLALARSHLYTTNT